MSVWDFDRFGRNQFLGEVRLSLSTLNLTDPTEHWYTLLDKVRAQMLFTIISYANLKHVCVHFLEVQDT